MSAWGHCRMLVVSVHSNPVPGSTLRSPHSWRKPTTNAHRAFLEGVVGCALLLLPGCGETTSGTTSARGAQDGQTNTQGTNGSSTGSTSGSDSSAITESGGNQTSAQGKGGSRARSTSSSDSQLVGGSGGSSQAGGASSTTSSKSQVSGGSSSDKTGGTVGQKGGSTSRGGTSGSQTGSIASGGTGGETSEQSGSVGGKTGQTATGGQTNTGVGGGLTSPCVGKEWPTANPTAAGPFEVAADKKVGPLAGYVPDPIYENEQQRFNIYRPKNLATSGYCHPILVWANGHTDNPEQNPPKCVTDSGANKWCGQYLPMMNHLASHGFVVIASLSTTTSRGDPLPTIAGLNWLLEQAEDSTSPYYNRLDTANIGQMGHSEGGMSTCMVASEPRYKALATICGTRALTGVHTPMLFFCGGKDTMVECPGVRDVFLTVKDQPAFFIKELNADHGSWVYQGAKGVSLSMAAAWFRVHLMGDTANRKYFYGSGCTFCTDNRVQVEQNSLMTQ